MPKQSSISDVAQNALRVVEKAIGEPLKPTHEKNASAVALGRLGGLKGGKARAAILSFDERQAIARKAANSRWGTKGK